MGRDSVPRSIHLSQIQHFLHKNPQGLTTHELAERVLLLLSLTG